MRACFQIDFTTPQGVALNGLWFGPKKAKRLVVWVHGLGSSAFSKLPIVDELVNTSTAVMTFNNRGHDKVASVIKGNKYIRGGAAHEVFTDCVDDIEGAIRFAKKNGIKEIFLAGHSTGCQKSIYWAAKKGKGVLGIILLAPMSDFAAEVKISGMKKISSTLHVAEAMISKGKGGELLSESVWGWSLLADAQRFTSLYSGKSAEEIFTYWAPERKPITLRTSSLPLLVLLAERDEYADRSASEIAQWFRDNLRRPFVVRVVPKAPHSFKGSETRVAQAIHMFIKDAII